MGDLMISKRSQMLPASPIRKLIPYSDEAENKGIHVYHLNIGQPDLETPEIYFNRIRSFSGVDAYTNSAGLMELREKFAEYYKKWGIPFERDEIIVTEGGSESALFAIATVADPGDEIIVIEPFYANYKAFAAILNVKLVPVTSHAENGYDMPPISDFERVLTSKTKAILFPNPGNPTGTVYSPERLSEIVNFAARHELYVISDEVYREITFDGLKAHSIMEFGHYDNLIVIDSLSKRFNACGARIGAFATKNETIFKNVLKMAMMRLSPNRLSQYGAIGFFELNDSYYKTMVKEYQKRRDIVYEELSRIPEIVISKPQGAFYFAAKIPVDNAEEFVKWMLTDFSVNAKTTMVAPLSGFYVTPNSGKDEIRIAYVLKEKELREACQILGLGIRAYKSERKSSKV